MYSVVEGNKERALISATLFFPDIDERVQVDWQWPLSGVNSAHYWYSRNTSTSK